MRSVAKRIRVIPFGRVLKRNMAGGDVLAVKRALSKAGFLSHPRGGFTRVMGPFTVRALKKFQRSRKLAVTGVYNPGSHRALAPFFDAYGAYLITGTLPRKPTSADRRRAVVAAMLLLYHHRDQVHYTQGPRRMWGVTQKIRPPKYPTDLDCSASVTWAYFAAGAPDPNDLGYSGVGYTGTLSKHGRKVSLTVAKPGALVFYGKRWPWQHVAVYIGAGKVISHGSEGGPYLLPVNYRSDRGEVREYL